MCKPFRHSISLHSIMDLQTCRCIRIPDVDRRLSQERCACSNCFVPTPPIDVIFALRLYFNHRVSLSAHYRGFRLVRCGMRGEHCSRPRAIQSPSGASLTLGTRASEQNPPRWGIAAGFKRMTFTTSTRRLYSSRISSAMLVFDSRTSSANGAFERHERHDSAGIRLHCI